MLDERWTPIMLEVDRLYWATVTHEGRINCIADYIIRLLNQQAAQPAVVDNAISTQEKEHA